MQMCIPKSLRDQVLDAFHGSAWAGHQGIKRTLERVRAHCWWPDWTRTVTSGSATAGPAKPIRALASSRAGPLVWRDRPPYPFHTIALDHFGPLPLSSSGLSICCGHGHVLGLGLVLRHHARRLQLRGHSAILVDQHCHAPWHPCQAP